MHPTLKIHMLLSGIIVGSIISQTGIIAPSIFKLLKENNVKIILRYIFPRMFILLWTAGLLSFICNVLLGVTSYIQYFVSALSFLFPLICYLLVPSTNQAKDGGDNRKFSRLHQISVLLTMIILVVNMLWSIFV